MATENNIVEIRPSVIAQQINDGMKLKPLAEYYNLPVAQMKKVLQQLGLQIRKFHSPKFVIVNEEEPTQVVTDDIDPETDPNVIVAEEVVETEDNW